MVEAIKEKTGIDFFEDMTFEDAKKLAEEHGIEVEAHFWYMDILSMNSLKNMLKKKLLNQHLYMVIQLKSHHLLKKNLEDPTFHTTF